MRRDKRWVMLRNVLIVYGVIVTVALLFFFAYTFTRAHLNTSTNSNSSSSNARGLLVAGHIIDDETGQSIRADVFLDGRIWARSVDKFEIFIWPGQSREISVRAEGYKTWSLVFTIPPVYSKREVFTGPVRLNRERSDHESFTLP